MTVAPHLDENLVSQAQEILKEMRGNSGSLRYAVVLTEDGFEVARWPYTDDSDGRIASMSSSIQALSEAIARELQMGTSEYVIVAAASGHLIQLRILNRPLVLAALFDEKEIVGKALMVSRLAADKMAAIEQQQAATPAVGTEPDGTSQG
jgi:hypothetical protein